MLWGYEEKFCTNYSLEEAVTSFKTNIPPHEKDLQAALYMHDDEDEEYLEIHHFFLARNKPVLSGTLPHRMVKTWTIDNRLLEQDKCEAQTQQNDPKR